MRGPLFLGRCPAGSVRSRLPSLGTVAAALAVAWTSACATPPERPSPPTGQGRFETAVQAVARDDLETAAGALHGLATDCRTGRWGREALLLWSLLELDPRYPEGSPDRAARLAAHYLQVPGVPPESLPLSEVIYLLALDLGAGPVDPSSPADDELSLATRFHDCSAEGELAPRRELPSHPGPSTTQAAFEAAKQQREALEDEVESLSSANAALAEKVEALETELRRIRGLLFPGAVPPDGDAAELP